MSTSTGIINPAKGLYIKLGTGGKWEKESLDKGILRFGYGRTPFEKAVSGDWKTVQQVWSRIRGDEGAATRDVIQIKHFFEADENTLWVTFHGGLLHWCFARPGVWVHESGDGSFRYAVNGWRSDDAKGKELSTDRLSGSLLKMQAFRGTICAVKDFEYLKRKLNRQLLPVVDQAEQAQNNMIQKIIPLMRLLTWQDFELLVDLVFSNSGWRRTGQVGKTQKTVDIELMLPTTRERAFVQIKSSAGKTDLAEYLERLKDSDAYEKMFFVWHTGEIDENEQSEAELVGPLRLARMVFDAGLTSWLREKVS